MNIRTIINNLMIIVVLIFMVHQYMVAQIISAARGGSSAGGAIQISDNASESEIIAAILPKEEDINRPYSWQGKQVTLTAQVPNNGYDMLVAMNRVQLDDAGKQRFAKLTKQIYHPCCDVAIANCGCKHAVAAQGLIKFLITQNYTDEDIKKEVFLWNRFWWPKHYASAAVYLSKEGINPANVSIDEWLGPKLSTFRSGRRMRAALGIR